MNEEILKYLNEKLKYYKNINTDYDEDEKIFIDGKILILEDIINDIENNNI